MDKNEKEFLRNQSLYTGLAIIGFLCWFLPVSVSGIIIILSTLVNFPEQIKTLVVLAALFMIGFMITGFYFIKLLQFIVTYGLIKKEKSEDKGAKR